MVLETGKPIAEAARELGVNAGTLARIHRVAVVDGLSGVVGRVGVLGHVEVAGLAG